VIARRLALLIVIAGVGAASGRARASVGLDPFRRLGAAAGDPLRVAPIRLAAAEPVSTPAPKPAPVARRACVDDSECPNDTICEQAFCQAVPTSTNIAWLYYREGTFREVLGLWWSRRGATGYTDVVPFYWHYWSPKGRTHVFAPLVWRFEDYKSQHVVTVVAPLFVTSRRPNGGFTWIFPFNFAWRDKDDSSLLVVPFFYGSTNKRGGTFISWLGYDSSDGPERDGAAFWLYWHGENTKAHSGYNVAFPLLWDFWDGEDRSTVFFPLVWSFSSAGENTTVAVPWFHLRRASWTFDTLFPLWWSGGDEKAGSAFHMLLPLFYWQSSNHGRQSALVTPLGGYARDADARAHTAVVLPLLSLWHRDPDDDLQIFTPLYIHEHSREQDSTTRLYGLALFYRRDDPRGSTTAVTPLFWHFHDADTGASATTLLPFFARRDGPRDTTTIVGAGLWAYWRSFKNGGWSAGLFPVAFFGANAGHTHAVVVPLLGHWSGPHESTTVTPLFYRHHDERGEAAGIPPLLTFFGQRDGDSYAIQFPLYWHFASERQGWSTTATPVFYHHRDADGWSVGVGPLLPVFYARSGKTRSHAVLFPVFWHFRDSDTDTSTTVIGPFWHRSRGHETTVGLFPLLYYRGGARPGGPDETSFTFLPFVHYHRDADTRVLVTPLGISARGPRRAAGFLGPYFWYKDATLDASFIPLLHVDITRLDTGERTRQFGPWFELSGPGHKAWLLFPLVGHYADANESDTYVFPSFFHQRRADGTHVDTLPPLYWHSSGNGRSTTVIGLWYDHDDARAHDTGFVPFWFFAKNERRTLTVIPLLLFARRHDFKADSERLLCALLWHTRDGAASATTLFPLWWAASSPDRSHHVLFPLFWRYTDTKADSAWTLAGPFYWSSQGHERTYGLLPLTWFSHDPSNGAGSFALMPLVYSSHGPNRSAFMTPFFGATRSPATRFTYAGAVVPLWFSHTAIDLETHIETHTTFFLPFLYFSRERPESRLTTVLALYWHHHDVTSSTTLGLPLYYDFHDYDISRTTVAFPLLFRHANEVAGTATWIGPLFYRRSTPTDATTIAFPLVWDIKRGNDRTTLVFPFVARWRRADHVSTWVFPTIYHRTGLAPDGAPDGTWRTVVAPFYDAAVNRPGDFAWDVLGGLFGHERVGRNRYLKLFFMRFEQEPAPRAQTAWYSQPARTPRRELARGLSMNTW
jgi:hypothetical protein